MGCLIHIPMVLAVCFCIPLFTIHPAIAPGDGAELTAAAHSLGMPHPSGYPLFMVMTKTVTHLLPMGNVAYRANIVSALFGALTCLMVYLITIRSMDDGKARSEKMGLVFQCRSLLSSHLSALLAALSLALSYEFWYRSTVAEVYTLNLFLVLLIIYIFLQWGDNPPQTSLNLKGEAKVGNDLRLIYLAAFLLGLGLGNHHTIILTAPGAMMFVAMKDGGWMGRWKDGLLTLPFFNLSTSLFFFLLGLSIYLYLPLRSSANPFMDWGDPQVFSNFMDVVTRKSYLPEGMEREWTRFIEQFKSFDPLNEFSIIGLLLASAGGWALLRRSGAEFALLGMPALLTSYGIILLAGTTKGDMELLKKFYLPAYAVLSILIGLGTAYLSGAWSYVEVKEGARSLIPLNLRLFLSLLPAVSLLTWQVFNHYPMNRNSASYLAYDYGMNELNSIREGGFYISKGDYKTFPLWYLQGVERYREDVTVVTAYFLGQRWHLPKTLSLAGKGLHEGIGSYDQTLVRAIYRQNADKRVYIGFLDEEYLPNDIATYSQGLTFRMYEPSEKPVERDVWPYFQLRGVGRMDDGMRKGVSDMLRDYASSRYNTALEYYENGDADRAIAELEEAIVINPEEPDTLNNLAALYSARGMKLGEAERLARRAIELYTTDQDKAVARETLEEVLKVRKRQKGNRL